MQIEGHLKGLKTSERRALERTFRRRVAADQVVSPELARHLTELSLAIGRQVGVLLTRDGEVRNVVVGDAHQLTVPDVGRLRGGVGRFRGLRWVHTHLRGEPLTQDDLNDLILLRLDLVAMIEVRSDGLPGRVELAHLAPLTSPNLDAEDAAQNWASGAEAIEEQPSTNDSEEPFQRVESPDIHRLDFDFLATMRALEAEMRRVVGGSERTGQERALVIGLRSEEAHFSETLELVRSAGVVAAGTLRSKAGKVHPRTVLGRGKLQQTVLESMRRGATVAIFDIDLKPAQARAFEDATGLKAIDRTQLILDVFAQRARSGDGKLQVELAQLKYSLPRLTRKDAGLSRLAGGIGGRGPGETLLEIGRRRIRDRIRKLERQTQRLSRQRDVRRRRRSRRGLPVLSIVGYTNAGKSTLLNAMTASEVAAANRLFMTLDPTSRRLRFPREGEVIITDTVGFLSELPRDLVAAFRATLEELGDADLLLHVLDAADPRLDEKRRAVESLLEELELGHLPRLRVLNKIDLVDSSRVSEMARQLDAVAVSAVERQGLGRLLQVAEGRLRKAPSLEDEGMRDRPDEAPFGLDMPRSEH
ncbi:MAG: GTPase HflX [Acidobacteriota bacterium]